MPCSTAASAICWSPTSHVERADALAARLAAGFAGAIVRSGPDLIEAAAQADGLVNATPVGMAKLPGIPLDPALLRPQCWVADIVYFPLETPLLAEARRRGCRTLNGQGMAVHQAALAFELFTGRKADVARMRSGFRRVRGRPAGAIGKRRKGGRHEGQCNPSSIPGRHGHRRQRRGLSGTAQDKPKLRFSAVFSEQDIRAEMMKRFADAIKDDFAFERYYGGTLFKQGTELVALQRGNLEMGNIAPQDISKQIPAWSIVTAGYLFRDAAHLKKLFASEMGAELKKMAEDQLGIHVLGPTYFGVRQVGLKPNKKINTPADMAGIKLRMPGGDAWQFLGISARRQPDADGLCRGLYRPADRRDRRAGQSAAECREHEVLRGDVADRADLASRRLRSARRLQQGLGRDGRREAGAASRRPPTRRST